MATEEQDVLLRVDDPMADEPRATLRICSCPVEGCDRKAAEGPGVDEFTCVDHGHVATMIDGKLERSESGG